MNSHNITNIYFSELSGSPLLNGKASLLLTIFLCLTSLFTGVFFSFCLSSADKASLIDPIRQMLQADSFSAFPSVLTNLFLLLLIFLAGLSLYGFAFSLLILTGKSLSLGFCGGLLYFASGSAGMKLLILSLLPVNLLLMGAVIPATAVALNYATAAISGKAQKGQYKKEYYMFFAIFAVLIILSAMLEALTMRIL